MLKKTNSTQIKYKKLQQFRTLNTNMTKMSSVIKYLSCYLYKSIEIIDYTYFRRNFSIILSDGSDPMFLVIFMSL